jgi:hypothetical protein
LGKNVLKTQPIMTFLDHGLLNFVPTFKKVLLDQFEKKISEKNSKIHAFLAHALTNVTPTLKEILNKLRKNHNKKFIELIVVS